MAAVVADVVMCVPLILTAHEQQQADAWRSSMHNSLMSVVMLRVADHECRIVAVLQLFESSTWLTGPVVHVSTCITHLRK
jgi:hypothetical protein